MSDAKILAIGEKGAGQAAPPPVRLEDTLTVESLEGFLLGRNTLGQALGVNVQEAYGIAELAWNLAEGGDLGRAVALAEGLVLLNPQHGYFHALLASIYIKQERRDDALRHLGFAIAADPKDIASRVNRGEILLGKGDFKAALEDLGKAIELDAGGTNPFAQRACLLVGLGAEILRRSLEKSGKAQ